MNVGEIANGNQPFFAQGCHRKSSSARESATIEPSEWRSCGPIGRTRP